MFEYSTKEDLAVSPPRVSTMESRLKVCMIAPCPFPANYGTPGSIREMAEALCERGHEVAIVTYPTGENIPVKGAHIYRVSSRDRKAGITVGPTMRRPLYDLQLVFKAIQVARRHGSDLIHAHGYEAVLAGWLSSKVNGLPVVCSGHHTMADELPSYRFIRPAWLARLFARFLDAVVPRLADRCIPHSTNMADFFHGMGLKNRTDPVANFGINLQEIPRGDGTAIRARYGLGDAPVVLYAGLLDEFQRLDLLLEAMVVVTRNEPRARLLIVLNVANASHLAALHERIAALNLTDRVVVTEPQPLTALWDHLAACDVAVVPRPQIPGFAIKLLNYMAAGKASVLFASSAGRDLVDRETARLVTPDTGEALGHGILEVLADKPLRQRLEANAQRFVQEHHDRRVIARQLCDVYRRALADSGRIPAVQTQPTLAPA